MRDETAGKGSIEIIDLKEAVEEDTVAQVPQVVAVIQFEDDAQASSVGPMLVGFSR